MQKSNSEDLTIQELRPEGRSSFSGLSGRVLKDIALVSMAMDHFAGCVVRFGILQRYHQLQDIANYNRWIDIYHVMRGIGRIAFPIFCFLLVEGCIHTRDSKKYGLRLLVFAFLSEIPFDLAIGFKPWYLDHQNVFLTLFLGWLMIYVIMESEKYTQRYEIRTLIRVVAIAACAGAAQLLRADYGAFGILIIAFFFLLCGQKMLFTPLVGATLLFDKSETYAVFALLPIWFYNGKRGNQKKYLFYIFYPAHFLFYYFLAYAIYAGKVF